MMNDADWYDLQTFGGRNRTLVIGDISSNHETDRDILNSVDFLRSRGCLIKLQAYRPDMPGLSHLKDYALSKEIMRHIANKDVFYSVFDTEMVDWLEKEVNPRYYKIACRSFNDFELIDKVRETGKQIFQSIPLGSYLPNPYRQFTYLHCVSEYPAQNARLERMTDYFEGYSDHTMNPVIPALAVARGARVIEHHFSIREMNTPDKCVSYLPHQWDEMLKHIKTAEDNILR